MPETRERRLVAATIELREDDDGAPRIVGHAAVFDSEADIGGFFREVVRPGAFRGAIARDDVRALVNHDANLVLGRNRSGTLRLAEDDTGLAVEISPPDTQAARDLAVSIRRGDVSGMSFAFRAERQEWDDRIDPPLRTLIEVRLFDVSVVTYPAYEDTDVGLRSLEAWRADNAPPPPPGPSLALLRRRLALMAAEG